MRFMVLVKANGNTEAGVMPSEQLLAEMTAFNTELVNAGILLAGEGLQPSSKGARIRFSGTERSVIDGPFAETKELIAGYWIWQVKSREEAIEWAKRCPNPTGEESVLELRQIFEPGDFGEALTPELREQEENLRAQAAKQTQSPAAPKLQVSPYLSFDGRCEEAFGFYAQVLGGKIQGLFPYAGTPVESHVPEDFRSKVMHATLTFGDQTLLGSDVQPDRYQKPGGMQVSLQIGDPAEAERIFRAFEPGATVTMPLQKTFWSERFGMLTDRFGIRWMFNCEGR